MFFINSLKNFSSNSENNIKPKKKKIGVGKKFIINTVNPDVANAAAVGASIGLAGSALKGGSVKANKIGAGAGLAVGTSAGIYNKYRKSKK